MKTLLSLVPLFLLITIFLPKFSGEKKHIQQPSSSNEKTEDGKSLYMKYCLSCHQADGSGVPNMYPPLKNSNWVNGDKRKLIDVILNGLDQEEIEVNGETYNQTMPTFNYLTDQQISQVLTFVRGNLNNHSSPISVEEIADQRKIQKK
jgi:mono/diheme cytochrome c family protein